MLFLIAFLMHFDIAKSIIGGYGIKIEDAPYQVSYGDICGAVLIDKSWAVTTAHCGTNHTYVRVGSTWRLYGTVINISEHFIHPLYQQDHEFDYDVQLLKFGRKLRVSANVKPISISRNYGDSILVAGWGYPKEGGDYHDTLQQVQMRLVPLSTCQRENLYWYNYTLTRRMFCAGGLEKDACQGDSGAGAVSQMGDLVGLSSFGYGCGRGVPGVYIHLTDFSIRNWIRFKLNE